MAITVRMVGLHATVSAPIRPGTASTSSFRHGQRCEAARLLAQLLLWTFASRRPSSFFKDMKFRPGRRSTRL